MWCPQFFVFLFLHVFCTCMFFFLFSFFLFLNLSFTFISLFHNNLWGANVPAATIYKIVGCVWIVRSDIVGAIFAGKWYAICHILYFNLFPPLSTVTFLVPFPSVGRPKTRRKTPHKMIVWDFECARACYFISFYFLPFQLFMCILVHTGAYDEHYVHIGAYWCILRVYWCLLAQYA